MSRTHQPDEERFRAILPEQIEWRPFPAFPPGVSLATLVGHPTETGPYLIRVPGSVLVLPGDTWHFHWAKSSEYVTQVSAIGPLGLEYANASDDPRQATSPR